MNLVARLLKLGRLACAAGAPLSADVRRFAADYPIRTITMIVPFAAGGPTDVIARIVAQHMSHDARPDDRDRERGRRRRHHRDHPGGARRPMTATR